MKRALLVLMIGCAPAPVPHHVPEWVAETGSGSAAPAASAASASPPATATPPASSIAARYREPVDKIVAAAHVDRGAYQKLAHLTDHIGNRLAGSAALDRAI